MCCRSWTGIRGIAVRFVVGADGDLAAPPSWSDRIDYILVHPRRQVAARLGQDLHTPTHGACWRPTVNPVTFSARLRNRADRQVRHRAVGALARKPQPIYANASSRSNSLAAQLADR